MLPTLANLDVLDGLSQLIICVGLFVLLIHTIEIIESIFVNPRVLYAFICD